MKIKKLISKIFLTLCICLTAGFMFLFPTLRFMSYFEAVLPESSAELRNPYIGWYQIYTYELSDNATFDLSEVSALDQEAGLALLEFNLKNYADGPVSGTGLSKLSQILEVWRCTGRQLIVRFLYDWDGNALASEPSSLSVILNHMTQISEIVNRYSDCIYILQGIFIGSWGEMHNSRYANAEDMLTLIKHLCSLTSPSILLAVRTPQQWRLFADSEEPLTKSAAFDGSLASRLGLFNDGMLGSDTDLNTYGSDISFPSSYEKQSREDELKFQNSLCNYVPNGGEVVIPNPRNDFSPAVKDLSDMHVSYLNSEYDKDVLSKWQAKTYTGEGPYQGMNGLDYISRHLGYRYVLRSSKCPSVLPWEKTASLSVTLENVGFSSCYRPFDISITLEETTTGQTEQLSVTADTRLLIPGESIQLAIPFEIRSYATGTYDVRLKITDPASNSPVFLANEGEQDENGYFIGQLKFGIFP